MQIVLDQLMSLAKADETRALLESDQSFPNTITCPGTLDVSSALAELPDGTRYLRVQSKVGAGLVDIPWLTQEINQQTGLEIDSVDGLREFLIDFPGQQPWEDAFERHQSMRWGVTTCNGCGDSPHPALSDPCSASKK